MHLIHIRGPCFERIQEWGFLAFEPALLSTMMAVIRLIAPESMMQLGVPLARSCVH